MLSIDALPLELWFQVSSYLSTAEVLKFRLVAPRILLPTINAAVFENFVVDIDGTDDLTRWEEAEADGIALKRLQEVAASRIVEHVRVLTLRLTRPYSLSAYYEQKLGVKNQPIRSTEKSPKPSTLKRISSFLLKPNKALTQSPPKVDYAAELASALQQLFKATDLVNQVRIVQPDGYNSEYDVVYPSVYARILVRFLTAVQSVNIPENTTLELLDIPVTHLEEAGLEISAPVASRALSKFSSLTLRSRYMAYKVVPHGSVKPALLRFVSGLNKNGLGYQLLAAISTNNSNFKSLKILDDARISLIDPIVSTTQWPNLRRLAFEDFRVTAELFGPFMVACLPQLEALSLRNGALLYKGQSAAWKDYFDEWVTLKGSLPIDQWSLKLLVAVNLYALTGEEIKTYAQKLVRQQPKGRSCKEIDGLNDAMAF